MTRHQYPHQLQPHRSSSRLWRLYWVAVLLALNLVFAAVSFAHQANADESLAISAGDCPITLPYLDSVTTEYVLDFGDPANDGLGDQSGNDENAWRRLRAVCLNGSQSGNAYSSINLLVPGIWGQTNTSYGYHFMRDVNTSTYHFLEPDTRYSTLQITGVAALLPTFGMIELQSIQTYSYLSPVKGENFTFAPDAYDEHTDGFPITQRDFNAVLAVTEAGTYNLHFTLFSQGFSDNTGILNLIVPRTETDEQLVIDLATPGEHQMCVTLDLEDGLNRISLRLKHWENGHSLFNITDAHFVNKEDDNESTGFGDMFDFDWLKDDGGEDNGFLQGLMGDGLSTPEIVDYRKPEHASGLLLLLDTWGLYAIVRPKRKK